MLRSVPITFMVGPSGAGRNTIMRELFEQGDFVDMITSTTRAPREENGSLEQDGIDYHFIPEEEMLENIRQQRMAEAALIHEQQVSGLTYEELVRLHGSKKFAISDIEPNGAANYHAMGARGHFVFVVPPDAGEWRRRLDGRGELSSEELLRRFKSAEVEIEAAVSVDFYHFVINDELEGAVKAVRKITEEGTRNPEWEAKGKEQAKLLLASVKQWIKEH